MIQDTWWLWTGRQDANSLPRPVVDDQRGRQHYTSSYAIDVQFMQRQEFLPRM